MRASIPKAKRIVLIGGGHTHALVLKSLAMKPIRDAQITLINPSPKAPYTGMLPGYVAGHYTRDEVEIDLIRLARLANAQIILDEATHIDKDTQVVALKGRNPISYDFASINVGITSELNALKGFSEFGHPAKPLGQFAKGWSDYLSALKGSSNKAKLAVIGGGVAGVELALCMAFRLKNDLDRDYELRIIERDGDILKGLSASARTNLKNHLKNYDIELFTNANCAEITETGLTFEGGGSVESDFTVGAAGATPHPWLSQTWLDHKDGFITTDEKLRVTNAPHIYATGDCAHFTPNPLPKAGVFAVRQAVTLLANLRAEMNGSTLRPYRPQKNYLKLISTGPKNAVLDKFGVGFDAPLLWRWKDQIDRKFMDRLNAPPKEMALENTSDLAPASIKLLNKYNMMCAGCGAKMDLSHLKSVLSDHQTDGRADILSGPGDDAAILKHGTGYQVFTTDHLRAFTQDPFLMGQIAAIHALGDIWAMGAEAQAATSSIILPRMSDHLHQSMLGEIMEGASRVFEDAGAQIVGGHTSIGSELTVGFSITGLKKTPPIETSGAKPKDVLILTKPIGVGTVLAGDMRGKADGYDIENAYLQMSRSSRKAAEILAPVAHAMTDVTGFGLAGHLQGIAQASSLSADLNLRAVPILNGALELAKKGVRSSIWASNKSSCSEIKTDDSPEAALLFDPQTAGGLLAAIPEEHAEEVLKSLLEIGEKAALIGVLEEGPAQVRITNT